MLLFDRMRWGRLNGCFFWCDQHGQQLCLGSMDVGSVGGNRSFFKLATSFYAVSHSALCPKACFFTKTAGSPLKRGYFPLPGIDDSPGCHNRTGNSVGSLASRGAVARICFWCDYCICRDGYQIQWGGLAVKYRITDEQGEGRGPM